MTTHTWRDDAVCRDVHDPELFFPLDADAARIPIAMCGRCPVDVECGLDADAQRAIGVWAGELRTEAWYRRRPSPETHARHLPRLAALVQTGTRMQAARLAGVSYEAIRETVDWAVACGYWERVACGKPGRVTHAGMDALRESGHLVAA